MWMGHKLILEEILPQKYEALQFILSYQHLLQLYNQFHSPTKSFKQSLGPLPHPPMQTTIYRSHDSNW